MRGSSEDGGLCTQQGLCQNSDTALFNLGILEVLGGGSRLGRRLTVQKSHEDDKVCYEEKRYERGRDEPGRAEKGHDFVVCERVKEIDRSNDVEDTEQRNRDASGR